MEDVRGRQDGPFEELEVIREERRLRVESSPTAKFEEQFDAMFWGSVPYDHHILGWPSDVESINRAQAEKFFDTYYAPNNITGVLAGSFDPAEVKPLLERYFGRIPRGEVDPPPVRGQNTREVLARVGEQVPEGTGLIPYPPNKPFLAWLGNVIRWGYFAWRSGNI